MLSAKVRHFVKAVHVSFAGIWLGALAGIVWLQASGAVEPDRRESFGVDLAVYWLHETVLLVAFFGTLTTGLVFSLFTKWGFIKHHWITTKWVLALALFAVTLWLQSPAVSGVVALSDAGLAEIHGHRYADYRTTSLAWAITQLAIVLVVFFISTIKPWGRRKRDLPVGRKTLLVVVGLLCAGGLAAAVLGYVNLQRLRTMPVTAELPETLADGCYRGATDCGFVYEVEVEVRSNAITEVTAVRNRDVHYAKIAEAVLPQIVERQTPSVDVITGASTTSKCLMRAAADALSGNGRDTCAGSASP